MKTGKARLFKGDIVRSSRTMRSYKVEEIQYDMACRRICVAFPDQGAGAGVRFFDSDENYVRVR